MFRAASSVPATIGRVFDKKMWRGRIADDHGDQEELTVGIARTVIRSMHKRIGERAFQRALKG
jgi:hypothetical protein